MTESNPAPYAFRGLAPMDRYMRDRRADVEAAFLVPHLATGMSLVDFGCGQGTITVGFAEYLHPGSVVGIDLQSEHIDYARKLAESKGLTNAQFRVGDVLSPDLAPGSFDVAYANAVLTHLAQPDEALLAMKEAVKPGGLIALRDRGADTVAAGIESETFMQAARIRMNVLDAVSKNPYGSQSIGLKLNALARKAGLSPEAVSGSWQILPSSHFTTIGYLDPIPANMAAQAIDLGLTTQSEIDGLAVGFGEWLADPDAFYAVPWFELIARKP